MKRIFILKSVLLSTIAIGSAWAQEDPFMQCKMKVLENESATREFILGAWEIVNPINESKEFMVGYRQTLFTGEIRVDFQGKVGEIELSNLKLTEGQGVQAKEQIIIEKAQFDVSDISVLPFISVGVESETVAIVSFSCEQKTLEDYINEGEDKAESKISSDQVQGQSKNLGNEVNFE